MRISKFKRKQKKALLHEGYEAMQKESKDIMKDFKAIDAVFSERAKESSVSYEKMLKKLKSNEKI